MLTAVVSGGRCPEFPASKPAGTSTPASTTTAPSGPSGRPTTAAATTPRGPTPPAPPPSKKPEGEWPQPMDGNWIDLWRYVCVCLRTGASVARSQPWVFVRNRFGRKNHVLAGELLDALWMCLCETDKMARTAAIRLLFMLLCRHENEARYCTAEFRSRIASLYLPLVWRVRTCRILLRRGAVARTVSGAHGSVVTGVAVVAVALDGSWWKIVSRWTDSSRRLPRWVTPSWRPSAGSCGGRRHRSSRNGSCPTRGPRWCIC